MSPSADKKYLLLDTCITEYWLNKQMNEAITAQISKWAGKTFELAISNISYTEMIDGARKEKTENVKDLLANYTQIELSKRILIGAGILGSVYKKLPKTPGSGMADKNLLLLPHLCIICQ